MDCKTFEDWLLTSEDRRAPPPDAAAHLRSCAECRQMAGDLDSLEHAWRETPPQSNPEISKQAFLDRLRDQTLNVPAARQRRPQAFGWRFALAASVFVAVALGSWVFSLDRQAEASADVLTRLVDWNLNLTQTDAGQRGKVYTRDADRMRASIAKARWQGSEAELANSLLGTAESLSKSDDALEHLDEFRDLADRLAELIEQAIDRGDAKRADLLARQYGRITESGMKLNLARAEASGALHLGRPGKLEKVILSDVSQAEALAKLLAKSPNLSRQEIREALGIRKEHANRKRAAPAAK